MATGVKICVSNNVGNASLTRKCWPCQCVADMSQLQHSGEMTGSVQFLGIINKIGLIHTRTVVENN